MKTLFILLLLSISLGAVAQRSFSKLVTTDGRQLRIRVDIEQPGRSVHYSRSFNVTDRTERAVKDLENHIIDSLERVSSSQITEERIERKRDTRSSAKQADEQLTDASGAETPATDCLQANATASLSPSDVAPSSVLVREDKENGRLWMQYTFQKDGEELVIERTANIIGKTEREKQAIIRETERSFGIKTGNQ